MLRYRKITTVETRSYLYLVEGMYDMYLGTMVKIIIFFSLILFIFAMIICLCQSIMVSMYVGMLMF